MRRKLSKTCIILLLLSLLFFFMSCDPIIPHVANPYDGVKSTFTIAFNPAETWTFMIYLDSANNLESDGINNFMQMVSGMSALTGGNVRCVVLMKRLDGFSSSTEIGAENWIGSRLYLINSTGYSGAADGSAYSLPNGASSMDGVDMGSSVTLQRFISYCKANYSAQHYALILWDHGGGAKSMTSGGDGHLFSLGPVKPLNRDIAVDDETGGVIYIGQVKEVLDATFSSSEKLDFLGFDACLMGTVEVAYEFRNRVKVMAGSMASEWGAGWNYDAFFSGMNRSGATNDDPKELGKLVVTMYRDYTLSGQENDQTMGAFDLSLIGSVKTAADELATMLYAENKKATLEKIRDLSINFYVDPSWSSFFPYYDINDFAELIINSDLFSSGLKAKASDLVSSLSQVVIAAYGGSDFGNYFGLGNVVKRGLSIFISRGEKTYSSGGEEVSEFYDQWWYTDVDTASLFGPGYLFGHLDFANTNANGIVDTWVELFKMWYDPTNSHSGGSI